MPRLYIRNMPKDVQVERGVANNIFYIEGGLLWRLGIDVINYDPRSYNVCVVSGGICWAVWSMNLMGNKQMHLNCLECYDETTRQHILMSDLLID